MLQEGPRLPGVERRRTCPEKSKTQISHFPGDHSQMLFLLLLPVHRYQLCGLSQEGEHLRGPGRHSTEFKGWRPWPLCLQLSLETQEKKAVKVSGASSPNLFLCYSPESNRPCKYQNFFPPPLKFSLMLSANRKHSWEHWNVSHLWPTLDGRESSSSWRGQCSNVLPYL